MNKLEETNLTISYLTKLNESGIKIDDSVILVDIAKSLAMIADKLCEAKSEEERNDKRRNSTVYKK